MQLRTRPARVTAALTTVLVTVATGLAAATPAQAANRATPGNFTGYGFDQCLAPSQSAMDAWLRSSQFWAVGIYISGDSRACPRQPNLTPAWVSTQLRNGWRLLPITLGPQASCTTRDRYLKQVRINPSPDNGYAKARRQGRAEAAKTVSRATELGIVPGSTLWYDLEGDFDMRKTDCRESALSFVSAWTNKLHDLGYRSGFYSSAGTGIKMLDDARVNRPGRFTMPDQIWVARWSGVPGRINDPGTYLRDDGWMPHARVHQYRGGHNETHGGVTINIDSNWLDVGRGTIAPKAPTHCGGVRIDFPDYTRVAPGSTGDLVRAVQCVLRNKKHFGGEVTGRFDAATATAVQSFRRSVGMPTASSVNRKVWTIMLSQGRGPLMKFGAGSHAVRRLQRSLNAATAAKLPVTGVFEARTTAAVKAYQARRGLAQTGVVTEQVWKQLNAGNR